MPQWKEEIREQLAGSGLDPARESAIVDELAEDLEQCYAELIAGGASAEDARRRTLDELDGRRLLVDELRGIEQRADLEPIRPKVKTRSHMLADLWQDLRYGARMLVKNPSFTLITLATLALGIGANAALFSVVNGVLLKPLPYPEPDQLVTFHQSKQNFPTGAIPYPNFLDLERENQAFAAMAISRPSGHTLTGVGDPEQVRGQRISANFFSILGVSPLIGRLFTEAENKAGSGPVVLISEELWRRKYEASPAALGKSINLDSGVFTIVGVIPASFKLAVSNFRPRDVYLPIGQWGIPALQNRKAALALHGIGRLKPGVSVAQAQADLDRVMRGLIAAYPDANQGNGAKVFALKERMTGGELRSTLLLLLGAVGFVLLIACVNVSNLLLARSTGRTREFAIRAALGARQGRLMRQLLVESILLAMIGGVLGLILAAWGVKAALSVMPAGLPRAEEIGLGPRVLLFTFVVSLLTGAFAGLAPALKPARLRLFETLKTSGQGASVARARTQGLFVAVEMALALVLLIGAGLLIRSLYAAWDVNPGFDPNKLFTFSLRTPPGLQIQNPDEIRGIAHEIEQQIQSAPGVRASSFSESAIPILAENDLYFWLDSWPKPTSTAEMRMTLYYVVDPGYLPTMGLTLKQGRFFTPQDDHRSTRVAVIDEAFARQYFKDQPALGAKLHLDGNDAPLEIVGVVGHVNQWGLDSENQEELQAQLYTPFRQSTPGQVLDVDVLVRSEGSEAAAYESIRRTLQEKNSKAMIFKPLTMNEAITNSLASRRFAMILLQAFALSALLLASVGLYGVISYLVGQQTREIGVRLALGAQPRDVLRLVLGHGMKMALAGVALGLVAAFALTRLMNSMLFGVSATDPLTFGGIALLLTIIALLACLFPARRATRVDPLTALRSE